MWIRESFFIRHEHNEKGLKIGENCRFDVTFAILAIVKNEVGYVLNYDFWKIWDVFRTLQLEALLEGYFLPDHLTVLNGTT